MKILKLLVLLTVIGCHDNTKDCVDTSKKKDGVCYEMYKPVCGCNGVTYSNDCFASAAGVLRWSEGACDE